MRWKRFHVFRWRASAHRRANALEAIRLINLWLPKAARLDDAHVTSKPVKAMAFGQYRRVWRSTAPVWGWFTRWRTLAGRNPQFAARRPQRYPAANCREF